MDARGNVTLQFYHSGLEFSLREYKWSQRKSSMLRMLPRDFSLHLLDACFYFKSVILLTSEELPSVVHTEHPSQKKGDMLSACRPFRWVLSIPVHLTSVILRTSLKVPAVIR